MSNLVDLGGGDATFGTDTGGEYELNVVVSDDHGADTSLSFPIHVADECFCPAPGVLPPSDLISWWPGDGNAFDIGGANNDGSIGSGVTFAPGFVTSGTGEAFAFEWFNDVVTIPNAPSLQPQELTLEAWINCDQAVYDAYGGVIVGKAITSVSPPTFSYGILGPGFPSAGASLSAFVRTTTGEVLSARSFDAPYSGARFLVDIHVAMTWDGLTMRLYMDGQEAAADSLGVSKTILYDGNDVTIGGWADSFPIVSTTAERRRFDGDIDEVSMYNRALTQPEIQAIYDAGSAGKCGK